MKLFVRYFAKQNENNNFEPIYTVLIQEYSDDYATLTDIYAISAHLSSRLYTVSKLHYSRSSRELELIFLEHFNYKYVLEDVSGQTICQLFEPQHDIFETHKVYGRECFHCDLEELHRADGTCITVSELNLPKLKKVKWGM